MKVWILKKDINGMGRNTVIIRSINFFVIVLIAGLSIFSASCGKKAEPKKEGPVAMEGIEGEESEEELSAEELCPEGEISTEVAESELIDEGEEDVPEEELVQKNSDQIEYKISQNDVGIPFFPGSIMDEENSMDVEDEAGKDFIVYLSTETDFKKVVEWYKKRLSGFEFQSEDEETLVTFIREESNYSKSVVIFSDQDNPGKVILILEASYF